MRAQRWLALAAASTAAVFVVFIFRLAPLGVPGELEIARLTRWDVPPAGVFELLLPVLAAVCLAAYLVWAMPKADAASGLSFGGMLAGALALSAAFQVSLEIAVPHGLQRWAALHNGFHFGARVKFNGVADVARNHRTVIAEMSPSHFTANPAGWVILSRAMQDYFDGHRDHAMAALKLQPGEMGWQLRHMVGNVSAADHASMTVVAVISRAAGLLVGLPLVWLAWMRFGRRAALFVGAMSNLLPTMPLLAPTHDTVYPTFATLAAALCYFACHCGGEHRRLKSGAAWASAGAVIGLGMMFSLCFLAVAALGFLLVARHNRAMIAATITATAAALFGWAAVVLLAYLLGYGAWDDWLVNLAKNREFNAHSGCTYWKWSIVNLLEFGASLGAPVVVFLAARAFRRELRDALFVAVAITVGLLDLSGSNLGEVSRLWLFLMPLCVLLAFEWLDFSVPSTIRRVVPSLLLLQALTCVVVDRELVLWWPVMPKQIQDQYTDPTGTVWAEYRRLSDAELDRRRSSAGPPRTRDDASPTRAR